MLPSAIVRFERLLLPALAIDLLNTMTAVHPDPANPFAASRAVLLLLYAVPSLIGLACWYFAARRGSDFARWAFVALLAMEILVFIDALAENGFSGRPWILASFAGLLKLGAAACLFLPGAHPWFDRGTGPAS
jgi:hypothetical protein